MYYQIIHPEQQWNIGLEYGEAWKGLGKDGRTNGMLCFRTGNRVPILYEGGGFSKKGIS
jgi:hypothetical protein